MDLWDVEALLCQGQRLFLPVADTSLEKKGQINYFCRVMWPAEESDCMPQKCQTATPNDVDDDDDT